MKILYDVIFRGTLKQGVSTTEAIAKMEKLFHISHEEAEKIFSQVNKSGEVKIRSDISKEEAEKYITMTFEKIGIVCVLKSTKNIELTLEEIKETSSTIKCPHCGKDNPSEAKSCSHCGVVFEIYNKQKGLEEKMLLEAARLREQYEQRFKQMQEKLELEMQKRLRHELEEEMQNKYKKKNRGIHMGYISSFIITVGLTLGFEILNDRAANATAHAILNKTHQEMVKQANDLSVNQSDSINTAQLNQLANTLIEQDNIDLAEDISSNYMNDPIKQVDILISIADNYRKKQEPAKETVMIEKALKIAYSASPPAISIQTLAIIANYLEKQKHTGKALDTYKNMLAVAQEQTDLSSQSILLALTAFHYAKSNLMQEKYKDIFNITLKQAKRIKPETARIQTTAKITNYLYQAGDISQAETLFTTLIAEAKKLKQAHEINNTLSIISLAQLESIDMITALGTLYQIKDNEVRDMTLLQFLEKTIQTSSLEESEGLINSIKSAEYQAKSYLTLGEHQKKAGLETQALASWDKANTLIDNIENKIAKSEVISLLAQYQSHQGNQAISDNLFSEALKTSTEISDETDKNQSLAHLAKQYARVGQLEKSIQIAKTIQDLSLQQTTLTEILQIQDKTIKLQSLQIKIYNETQSSPT